MLLPVLPPTLVTPRVILQRLVSLILPLPMFPLVLLRTLPWVPLWVLPLPPMLFAAPLSMLALVVSS